MSTEKIKKKTIEIIPQLKGMTYSEIRELFQITLKEIENKVIVN